MGKMAIIGSCGLGSVIPAIAHTLKAKGDQVIICDLEKQENYSTLNNNEAIPYVRRHDHVLREHSEEKPFICKGKHQYRKAIETRNNLTHVYWVCQCGKKL